MYILISKEVSKSRCCDKKPFVKLDEKLFGEPRNCKLFLSPEECEAIKDENDRSKFL